MGVLVCEIILYALVFITGTCIFSFLNVIVYRVPKKMSFIKGHSICPSCGHTLGAADLVPIFSWLFLRGKCRYCGARVSGRDTFVELLGGTAALFCVFKCENLAEAVTVFAFYCIMTVTAFLDIDTMEIEDGCWIAAALLAVAAYFTMPGHGIADRLIGMVCVSVPMLLLALAIPGAFGGGDIKLMAGCGLFLGWRATLVATVIAILLGGGYGVWLLAAKKAERKSHFAFGPFLCTGMAVAVMYAEELIRLYLKFVGLA